MIFHESPLNSSTFQACANPATANGTFINMPSILLEKVTGMKWFWEWALGIQIPCHLERPRAILSSSTLYNKPL